VDVVFHVAGAIAALAPTDFDRVNREGTTRLVTAVIAAVARGDAPGHFVHVSSLAAAGPSGSDAPVRDGAEPRPISAYGRSKLAAEAALAPLRGRVAVTIVRPPSVYGSGDTATLDLFRAVRGHVVLAQSGRERRMSFVHAGDLARGLRLAAEHPPPEWRVLYLTGPEDRSLSGFQREIARAMGLRAVEIPIPDALLRAAGFAADLTSRVTGRARPFGRDKVVEGLARGWLVTNDLARREIGYEPRIRLGEGIAEALTWYRARGWL
jgi:nucleoside-diphosphate-sugar epimerase